MNKKEVKGEEKQSSSPTLYYCDDCNKKLFNEVEKNAHKGHKVEVYIEPTLMRCIFDRNLLTEKMIEKGECFQHQLVYASRCSLWEWIKVKVIWELFGAPYERKKFLVKLFKNINE